MILSNLILNAHIIKISIDNENELMKSKGLF